MPEICGQKGSGGVHSSFCSALLKASISQMTRYLSRCRSGTRPDGIAVVVYCDKRAAQVPGGQLERGASRSGGARSIQRGEKMEGAEKMGGRVGHRHVPMADGIDLRHLLWLGMFRTTRHQHGLLLRARRAIYSPGLNCSSKVTGADWIYIGHLTNRRRRTPVEEGAQCG